MVFHIEENDLETERYSVIQDVYYWCIIVTHT